MNKFFEYIDRVSMMHKLISQQHTGSPDEFAARLGVKRTRLYEILDEFKTRGHPSITLKSPSLSFMSIHTILGLPVICSP